MTNSRFYTTADIQSIFQVGKSVAQRILRSAKAYQDKLAVKGKILITDFEAWENSRTAESEEVT